MADGSTSPAPEDGFAGFRGKRLCAGYGGVGPAALCSKVCCCHNEEYVVLRFEKRTDIDHGKKTESISNQSIVSICVDVQEKVEQFTEHEKVTEVHGIEQLVFKNEVRKHR